MTASREIDFNDTSYMPAVQVPGTVSIGQPSTSFHHKAKAHKPQDELIKMHQNTGDI